MPIGILFWLILILWFLFGLYWNWPREGGAPVGFLGSQIMFLILFGLIGWKLFGPVLQ
jgi:hypothetical protein